MYAFLSASKGGEESRRAWPRLAEYFARFQLSIDLQCSLEVRASVFQSVPLYIKTPAEIERQRRTRNEQLADTSSGDGNGDDGCDDGDPVDDETGHQEPMPSKAAQKRAQAEEQRKKKMSLVHEGAKRYKRRQDLRVQNVAFSAQPIRRNVSSSQSVSSKNTGPTLEVGFVVFGPKPEEADSSDDDDENENNPQSQNESNQSNDTRTTKLQVIRMVNGIPLLDSSEALACGVVQKISNNAATWNSFGLNVVQNSSHDLDPVPLNEQNTPTFDLSDSAQVAPFLKSTTHSLFQDESQEYSSDDDDDFDVENMRGGKRKKERHAKCILPASLRLGDVLMVVNIRAKPSALPLPTLSKVSL